MGDDAGEPEEKPAHSVIFTNPIKMGRYEVTFDEYDVFVELTKRDGGCLEDPNLPAGSRTTVERPIDERSWGRKRRPVINVSYYDAICYASWLSQVTGKRFRLPTEAEWEYVARANTTTLFFWGNNKEQASEHAWFRYNSYDGTHPVGEPGHQNAFGLYDLAGNVWEWTQDCGHSDYTDAPNTGTAWEEANDGNCTQRVLRGGSWNRETGSLRSARRYRIYGNTHLNSFGFRLAQDLP